MTQSLYTLLQQIKNQCKCNRTVQNKQSPATSAVDTEIHDYKHGLPDKEYIAPLWCDLGCSSRTVVVIKLLRTSAFNLQYKKEMRERGEVIVGYLGRNNSRRNDLMRAETRTGRV